MNYRDFLQKIIYKIINPLIHGLIWLHITPNIITFVGLLLNGYVWSGVVTFTAMVGSVMVSYVRARAEGLGIECKVGFMQRPERVVVTAVGALLCGICADCVSFDPLWFVIVPMWLIAILANLTAFWRIGHCYKELTIDN